MPQQVELRHRGGDRFAVTVRGHELLVDQPVDAGGTDEAPTPTELFIAGLVSCVAFYARRYLHRHNLPEEGLAATATYSLGGRPGRVTNIHVRLQVPDGVPAERRDALLAVASHCTVHNTLMSAPEVDVSLADAAAEAA